MHKLKDHSLKVPLSSRECKGMIHALRLDLGLQLRSVS